MFQLALKQKIGDRKIQFFVNIPGFSVIDLEHHIVDEAENPRPKLGA